MSKNEVLEEETVIPSPKDAKRNERLVGFSQMELEKAVEINAPPVITVPSCHTCQSPHRLWIENMLSKGVSYASIARSIPNGPDRRSISHHYTNHMRVDQAIFRGVLEDEAGLLGQNIEEGIRGAFTIRGALNVLIRKAYDDAIAGITTVEPRDLIQMAKLYNDMDSSASIQAVEEAKIAVGIMGESIKNVFANMDDTELAQSLQRELVQEIRRMRQQDEVDTLIENELRELPRVKSPNK